MRPADPQILESLESKHALIGMAEMRYGTKEKNPQPTFNSIQNRTVVCSYFCFALERILLRVYTGDTRYVFYVCFNRSTVTQQHSETGSTASYNSIPSRDLIKNRMKSRRVGCPF